MKKSCYKQRTGLATVSVMVQVVVALLLCFAWSHEALAQEGRNTARPREITGIVTDALTNDPLPGVTVLLKGAKTAVVTDGNGRYAITVPAGNHTLVFSFIGFITKEEMV